MGVVILVLILENGDLLMFGRGRDGQLGRGSQLESMAAYRTEPKKVEDLTHVSKIALGTNHSLALVGL